MSSKRFKKLPENTSSLAADVIEKILSENGYKLIAIEDSGNLISFSNLQTNLIYVKNEIYEEIRELHYKNIDISDVTKSVSKKHPFSY